VLAKFGLHVRHNVVGYVALFAALGGTSYAAIRLPANSVGAKQIKAKAVRAAEVKNGSLGLAELSGRAESALQGRRGLQGLQGVAGEQGQPGSPAASVIQGNTDTTLLTLPASEDVFAPSGFTAFNETGAGATSIQSTPNATIVIRDLFGQVNTAPGPGASRTVRLQAFNPGRILISCTISGTDTTCNSGSESVTVPPGTQYRASISTGSVAPAASVGASWAFRATTP
jgi:hypothetical protein